METALTTSEGGSRGREEERLEGRVKTKILSMHRDIKDSLDVSGLDIPEEVVKTADQYDQSKKYAGIAEEIEQVRQEFESLGDELSYLRHTWTKVGTMPDFALAGSYA